MQWNEMQQLSILVSPPVFQPFFLLIWELWPHPAKAKHIPVQQNCHDFLVVIMKPFWSSLCHTTWCVLSFRCFRVYADFFIFVLLEMNGYLFNFWSKANTCSSCHLFYGFGCKNIQNSNIFNWVSLFFLCCHVQILPG